MDDDEIREYIEHFHDNCLRSSLFGIDYCIENNIKYGLNASGVVCLYEQALKSDNGKLILPNGLEDIDNAKVLRSSLNGVHTVDLGTVRYIPAFTFDDSKVKTIIGENIVAVITYSINEDVEYLYLPRLKTMSMDLLNRLNLKGGNIGGIKIKDNTYFKKLVTKCNENFDTFLDFSLVGDLLDE